MPSSITLLKKLEEYIYSLVEEQINKTHYMQAKEYYVAVRTK